MTEVNKARKCWYTTSEAMEHILESDSDDDNDFTVEKNVVDAKSEIKSDTADTENSEEQLDASTSKDKRSRSNKNEHESRWRSKVPPIINSTFHGDKFSPLPETFDEMLPIDFLKIFWTDNITNMIAEQTNLYSVQNKGSSNVFKIQKFI